jgi:hypothetical protein
MSDSFNPASAIAFSEGGCNAAKPATGQLKLVGGNVQTLTGGSITVSLAGGGSFSCFLDDRARAEISKQHIKTGDQVGALCTYKGGAWTLLHIKKLNVPKPADGKDRH